MDKSSALSFDNFSFIYGGNKRKSPSVSDISFNLNEGEVLILAGPSGSGKSTLSYAMNGIVPWRLKGFMKGDVRIFNKSVWDYDFMELSEKVGLVKQNPIDQLVTFRVKDEIAFGLENLKYHEEEIKKRVKEVSEFMGIGHLLERDVDQLSGGQKQLVILCSFLVMEPSILILDEPIAFLDQKSESFLLERLNKLIKSPKYNLTVVIIEHRLSRVVDFADKIVVLAEDGTIRLKGKVSEVLKNNFDVLRKCNVRVPWINNVFFKFKESLSPETKEITIPTNFRELIKIPDELSKNELEKFATILKNTEIKPNILEKYDKFEEKIEFGELYTQKMLKRVVNKHESQESSIIDLNTKNNKKFILETIDLNFKYPNTDIKAITNLSIKIREGDFIGLIGPNGSGKTTLLYLLANLYEPTSGQVLFKNKPISEYDPHEYARKIGFIFQNPENMIFKPTLKEEILYGPENFGISDKIDDKYLKKLISLIGNEEESKNPFNLSWGQKRRLNLSSIFVYKPDIILLDEPFIGQDQRTIDSIIETLYIENKRGKTIIISSHDYHLLLKYTKLIIELNKDGSLRNYDSNGNFFNKHKNLGPIVLMEKIKQKLVSAVE
ncbi:MAG: ATP-binding cassette domain-containing protein [Candidatus Lokiarchaeota archaeon]|nr:ATP-binding cassette domain-containing protein [Candidatus Lokiarchaeota archaeon]MBD3338882.1 ATP-binding cassette domain-containing protein [Candidatus Lokiarchaeota archaeon]